MIYSIKDKDSFSTINNWITEIKTKANEDVVVFLIGNKCDLDKDREVSKKDGETLAEKYKIPFYESSAKLDVNVKNVFEELAQMVVDNSGNVVESKELNIKNNKKGEKLLLNYFISISILYRLQIIIHYFNIYLYYLFRT